MFVGLIVFVGIQLVPTKRNQNSDILESDFNEIFNVSNNVESIIKNSCYDCHSNNTYYPWYNKIQPVSWFLEKHVTEGKKELNFSEFGNYSTRKQKSKLKSIINQIKEGKMPLWSYTLMHNKAVINESDKLLIENWITTVLDSIQ
jgi:hypothetical protein